MRTLWSVVVALLVMPACGQPDLTTSAGDADVDPLMDTGPSHPDAGIDSGSVADAADSGVSDTGAADAYAADTAGSGDASMDGADTSDPPPRPMQVAPCSNADCWDTSIAAHRCRRALIDENYRTGKYNVHRWETTFYEAKRNVVEVEATAGNWTPAVVIIQSDGTVLFDGRIGLQDGGPVEAELTTASAGRIRVRVDASREVVADVFVTSQAALENAFETRLPTSAEYTLSVESFCENPPSDELQLPPNFDENDVENGYYLLPDSQPAGLYTRKADGCSRGNKLLIKVLYTVALQWNMLRPKYSPITILDLNEGPCSGVDHATHDDGTHVDIKAKCATRKACSDTQPAIDLAKLFVDTGQVCGIIFNDTAVQGVINPYFQANYNFTPWHGTFMRSVGSHVTHFHIRVKKPDGSCN